MKRKHLNAIIWLGIIVSGISFLLGVYDVPHMESVARWAMTITGSICIFDMLFLT